LATELSVEVVGDRVNLIWLQGRFLTFFFSLEVSFCASVEEDHKSCGLDAANLEQI